MWQLKHKRAKWFNHDHTSGSLLEASNSDLYILQVSVINIATQKGFLAHC